MLKNLAAQLSPTDEIRKQEIELEWQGLHSSWSKGVNVDQWLHKWKFTYSKMVRIISSDIKGLKPVYKFLNSVNTLDTQFATSWTFKLSMGERTNFPKLLVIFRNYRHNSANSLKNQLQNGAFPVLHGMNESGDLRSSQGDSSKPRRRCPCGSRPKFGRTTEYCAYPIHEAAKYWNQKLDPTKMKNVEEKLKNDEEFRDQVNQWRRNYKPPKDKIVPNALNSQGSTNNQRSNIPPITAMASTGKMSPFNTTKSTFQVSGSTVNPVYDLEQS